jgi:hypothetical protein
MAWAATENFDSYTNGVDLHSLNGGSGWTGAWVRGDASTVAITNSYYLNSPNGCGDVGPSSEPSYTRTFTALSGTTNVMHFAVMFTSTAGSSGGRNYGMTLVSSDSAAYTTIRLDYNGNRIYMYSSGGGGVIVIQSGVSADTWYHIYVNFDITNLQAKVAASTSIITSEPTWSTAGTLANKTWDRVGPNGQFGVGGSYTSVLDDIREGSQDWAVTTGIATVNGLAKASVGSVNGLATASVGSINGLA